MTNIAGVTRGGEAYTPRFVLEFDQAKCIGCGRCYKVCARDVFALVERDADVESEDDEDEFSDETSMVMSLGNPLDCIGCEACARVCTKACMTHGHSPIVEAV